MRVLVGHSSHRGSTQGIAERIATRLCAHELQAEARPLIDVQEIEAYDAVVIGSPIFRGSWPAEAGEFVRRWHDALRGRAVWAFSVGLKGTQRGILRRMLEWQPEPEQVAALRRACSLHGYRNFAGVLRPDHNPWLGRVFMAAVGGRYGDFRNWRAIDDWADTIADQLRPSDSPPDA